MAEEISHKGRIIEITPEVTSVEIISESACGSCHAKSLCSMSESKSKVVQIRTSGWDPHNVGDEVEVVLKASMGHKAVWLAYVVPLVVLMTFIVGFTEAGFSELVCGLSGIGAVVVYYFFLWLFRKKLQNEYIFNIK